MEGPRKFWKNDIGKNSRNFSLVGWWGEGVRGLPCRNHGNQLNMRADDLMKDWLTTDIGDSAFAGHLIENSPNFEKESVALIHQENNYRKRLAFRGNWNCSSLQTAQCNCSKQDRSGVQFCQHSIWLQNVHGIWKPCICPFNLVRRLVHNRQVKFPSKSRQ